MKADIREFFYGFDRPQSTSIDLSTVSPKVLVRFCMGLVGFHLKVEDQTEPRIKIFMLFFFAKKRIKSIV